MPRHDFLLGILCARILDIQHESEVHSSILNLRAITTLGCRLAHHSMISEYACCSQDIVILEGKTRAMQIIGCVRHCVGVSSRHDGDFLNDHISINLKSC